MSGTNEVLERIDAALRAVDATPGPTLRRQRCDDCEVSWDGDEPCWMCGKTLPWRSPSRSEDQSMSLQDLIEASGMHLNGIYPSGYHRVVVSSPRRAGRVSAIADAVADAIRRGRLHIVAPRTQAEEEIEERAREMSREAMRRAVARGWQARGDFNSDHTSLYLQMVSAPVITGDSAAIIRGIDV